MKKKLANIFSMADSKLAACLRPHWPGGYVRVRWPLLKPYQRNALKLLPPGGGLGDELMASGVIAEIKKANPACHITLVSRHPAFWKNHPLIELVEEKQAGQTAHGLSLLYGFQVPSKGNVFAMLCERAGLNRTQIKPVPPPLKPSPALVEKLASLPRPWLVVQPEASSWSPNKNWPRERWVQTILALQRSGTVIETGTRSIFSPAEMPVGLCSFAGTTTLHDVAHLIKSANLFIGPDSSGMHLAAAFDTPAVIVFGGYTSPENFPYPNQRGVFTSLHCSPCWLSTPCPYAQECLTGITPDMVIKDARELLAKTLKRAATGG